MLRFGLASWSAGPIPEGSRLTSVLCCSATGTIDLVIDWKTDVNPTAQQIELYREQLAEPLLALDQRPRMEIFAVEVEEIEQEENQRRRVAAIGSQLNDVESSDAVGPYAAQFAVEIGLPGAERRHRRGDRGIFMRPVEPGAGQQFDRAAVEPRMHAVAIEFDFVQPLIAIRRRIEQLRELRPDPLRECGRLAAPRAR